MEKQFNDLLTSTRTLESLCQELVEEGLLKKANNVGLQDYLGKILYVVCVHHLSQPVFVLSFVSDVIVIDVFNMIVDVVAIQSSQCV